ncbi:hypothetical protein S10a_00014 [Klebsiella phage VLCpiS10a]|nr:hypothetical protein S10a_00014 [Klebsiella phage VLCpiS10a]
MKVDGIDISKVFLKSTLIHIRLKLHLDSGYGPCRKFTQNITSIRKVTKMLERIVITIIFLISVALVSSNLAFISEQWVLALTGVVAALASIAACMWGAQND